MTGSNWNSLDGLLRRFTKRKGKPFGEYSQDPPISIGTVNINVYLEGSAMSKETNIAVNDSTGVAANVGDGSSASVGHATSHPGKPIDFQGLAAGLAALRSAMREATDGSVERDQAIGIIADAESHAQHENQSEMNSALEKAGPWALSIAQKVAVPVLVDYFKSLLNS